MPTPQTPSAHPNIVAPLPFACDRFTVDTVQTGRANATHRHDNAGDAVDDAAGRVGPNVGQASITAWTGDHETFAVRHIVHDGQVCTDTGWRCWVDGEFVGAGVDAEAAR